MGTNYMGGIQSSRFMEMLGAHLQRRVLREENSGTAQVLRVGREEELEG